VLGDHPAHTRAQQMKFLNAQRIHQPQGITRHIAQPIRRADRQTKPVAQHLVGQIGLGRLSIPTAQTHVPVVEADYPEALLAQLLDHIIRPMDQLPTQPHDQQQRRIAVTTDALVRQAHIAHGHALSVRADLAHLSRQTRKAAQQGRQKNNHAHHEFHER